MIPSYCNKLFYQGLYQVNDLSNLLIRATHVAKYENVSKYVKSSLFLIPLHLATI